MTVNDHLLSLDTAADVLGIGRSTLDRIVAAGEIPTVVLGRRKDGKTATRRMIASSDLKRYIEAHREGRKEAP